MLFLKHRLARKPTGANRTDVGSSSSGISGWNRAFGERWHSAQTCTSPGAEKCPAFRIVFDNGIEDFAAAMCRLPGPWHRSHVTPGRMPLRSGPSWTPVAWQPKQRVIASRDSITPAAACASAGSAAECPGVKPRRPDCLYQETRCSTNSSPILPTGVYAFDPAPKTHSSNRSK